MAYEDSILRLIGDGNEDGGNEQRILRQMERGATREQATRMNAAGVKAMTEATRAAMRVVDEYANLGPEQTNILLYVMRMVVTNMNALEDVINMMVMEMAVLNGIPVAMPMGGNPDCNCPSCSAARAANEAAVRGHTRH